MAKNALYYGDNLEVLRRHVKDETVDLCYLDPPFNSKRQYFQIYNNIGTEDRARAQAFTDTWIWDDMAIAGFDEILDNANGRFSVRSVDLATGLHKVLGRGSLLAYLVSLTLRVTELHRTLKETGSLYLHCDPTASHYIKLMLDAIFVPSGGEFQNEIIWNYQTGGASKERYARKHDVIFFYTKSKAFTFNGDAIREPRSEKAMKRAQNPKGARIAADDVDKLPTDVFRIPALNPMARERMGYPTQKPEILLERIVAASSNEGDVILDAYSGCGTTVVVAQRTNRKWIGIDITYQSISLVLKRLEATFSARVADAVVLNGIPRNMGSAEALARKKDDRLRKEFEKWAVLTYTKNRAVINQKKGADGGIDGVAYFKTGSRDNAKIIFQVKSGTVAREDVAALRGDMERIGAAMSVLITLENPTAPMIRDAEAAEQFKLEEFAKTHDRITIVTIKDIIEGGKRLELPMSLEVLKAAQKDQDEGQLALL